MIKKSNTFILLLLLSGCMVGPNYKRPTEILPEHYVENRCEGPPELACEDLTHWWTTFNDPFLDSLLAEGLQGSFDLLIALEKIHQARANYWIQNTALYPDIESDLLMTRSRASQAVITNTPTTVEFPPIQNFYQANIDAIWKIDLFGGLRRAARAACDSLQASVEDARGVRILVLSEIAITYTNICALQQVQAIQLQTVHIDEELLNLSLIRFDGGLTDEQEVETATAKLEADRALLDITDIQLKQAIYSLAILLARPPESLVEMFCESRPIPSAVAKIPVGLPSDLLRRRPDIRSAERQLAAATENIGVAVANLFPQVSLTGTSASFSSNPLQGSNIGTASTTLSEWFTGRSLIWGIGYFVSLPLFDFGKRLAMIDEEVALRNQAFLTYEKTVIAALQEVESDLVAYCKEEERLLSLTKESEANRRNWDLVADLYQAGLADVSAVLSAEETWLLSLTDVTISQQALSANLIALYEALGGGWECSYMP